MKNRNAVQQALDWNAENKQMPALNVPDKYTATYMYQLPVICFGQKPGTLPDNFTYTEKDNWGIISITSNHEFTSDEINIQQNVLDRHGLNSISKLRLVKQTFSLIKDIKKG